MAGRSQILGSRALARHPGMALAVGIAAVLVVLPLAALGITVGAEYVQSACSGQTGAQSQGEDQAQTVSAPAGSVQTMGQMVSYLESQAVPAVDAAGIVGNLMQESGLNPASDNPATGFGMAQWNATWWQVVSSWIRGQDQEPFSAGGQLEYIAANVTDGLDAGRFSAYVGLSADLAAAKTPQQAAIVWMNDYEQCSGAGAPGSLSFTPASLCEAGQREAYALEAYHAAGGQGSSQFVSLDSSSSSSPSSGCNATEGSQALTGSIAGYTNPFAKATGISWERTDEGVDVAMDPGSPMLAFAPSTVMEIVPFFVGQPAIVLRVDSGLLAGKWWYLAEQVTPTVTPGQRVAAGQTVGIYAPAGTAIEIGWWTPNSGYPLAHAGYHEGAATLPGADFRFLLQALGANPGTGASQSSGLTFGSSYYPPVAS